MTFNRRGFREEETISKMQNLFPFVKMVCRSNPSTSLRKGLLMKGWLVIANYLNYAVNFFEEYQTLLVGIMILFIWTIIVIASNSELLGFALKDIAKLRVSHVAPFSLYWLLLHSWIFSSMLCSLSFPAAFTALLFFFFLCYYLGCLFSLFTSPYFMLCFYFHFATSQDLAGISGKTEHTFVYIWDCTERQSFISLPFGLCLPLRTSRCKAAVWRVLQVLQVIFQGRRGEKVHRNIIFPANIERFWGKARNSQFVNFIWLKSSSDNKQHA